MESARPLSARATAYLEQLNDDPDAAGEGEEEEEAKEASGQRPTALKRPPLPPAAALGRSNSGRSFVSRLRADVSTPRSSDGAATPSDTEEEAPQPAAEDDLEDILALAKQKATVSDDPYAVIHQLIGLIDVLQVPCYCPLLLTAVLNTPLSLLPFPSQRERDPVVKDRSRRSGQAAGEGGRSLAPVKSTKRGDIAGNVAEEERSVEDLMAENDRLRMENGNMYFLLEVTQMWDLSAATEYDACSTLVSRSIVTGK